MRTLSLILALMALGVAAMATLAADFDGSFATSNANEGDRFFSVSGSFARSWIDALQKETDISPDASNDLWSWGGTPRGKAIEDGMLVEINLTKKANNYSDWLGSSLYQEPILVNNATYGQNNQWMPPF